MKRPFYKYVACGNDFIHFDNRKNDFPFSQLQLIEKLCHRHYGIGADGVLLLESSDKADFRMRIFNADGSEAEMCGNGLRCFTRWLIHLGFAFPSFRIEVMDRILQTWPTHENVCVEIGSISQMQWNISFPYKEKILRLHHLDTGVPHTVLFTENIDSDPLHEYGNYIRHHSNWQPRGTNLTLAQRIDQHTLRIRTYERGVEGETLACGTGAAAAALAAYYIHSCTSPVGVKMQSGEEVQVTFTANFSNVTLTGSAFRVYQGEVDLDCLEPVEFSKIQKVSSCYH